MIVNILLTKNYREIEYAMQNNLLDVPEEILSVGKLFFNIEDVVCAYENVVPNSPEQPVFTATLVTRGDNVETFRLCGNNAALMLREKFKLSSDK